MGDAEALGKVGSLFGGWMDDRRAWPADGRYATMGESGWERRSLWAVAVDVEVRICALCIL